MKLIFSSLCVVIFVSGCAKRDSNVEKYAVLRIGSADRVQVSIEGTYWEPLISAEGFGGPRRALFYWSTLSGAGPEYKDPILNENSPYMQPRHTGFIRVDRKAGMVTIQLDQVVPSASDHGPNLGLGPGVRNGPSPANGVYRVKKISKEVFIAPE